MGTKADEYIEKLYRAEYPKLLRYASSKVRNSSRAQDLVQDTFHDAICKKDMLLKHPKPEAWLMMTLKNKIMVSEREKQQYINKFSSYEDTDRSESAVTLALNQAHETEKFNLAMQTIRSALSKEEYYLFKRIVMDEASHLEVATEMGITVWTSQQRLARIKKKLQKYFPEHRKKHKNLKILCQFLLLFCNI